MIPYILVAGIALAPETALPAGTTLPAPQIDGGSRSAVTTADKAPKPRAVPPANRGLMLAGRTTVAAGAIGVGAVLVRLVFEGLAQKASTTALGVGPPCVGPNCNPPPSDVGQYWSWIALASLSTTALGSVMWALGANETRDAAAGSGAPSRLSIGVVPLEGGAAGSLSLEF